MQVNLSSDWAIVRFEQMAKSFCMQSFCRCDILTFLPYKHKSAIQSSTFLES